jgi:NAD(P)-dependent dehydrogenase (short-subunit alcohol dehydrogenase family)
MKKIAIIGVSGGIGNSLLEHYLLNKNLSEVYAFSRTPIQHSDHRVKAACIDFSNTKSIEQAVLDTKPHSLDLVIAATGILHEEQITPEKTLKNLNEENITKLFKINTIGPALLMKSFLPLLTSEKRAVFVALSARIGSISDNYIGGWYSYRASKAALNMLVKTAAIEYSRINKHLIIAGLHPGTVDTKLSKPYQSRINKEKIFSPFKAAAQLAIVIENLHSADSGKCLAWNGKEIQP